jgi:MoaA/NifB/PqqE/SkfB family radical SAM enzyme
MRILKILKYYGYFRNHRYFYYLFPYHYFLKLFRKRRLLIAEIFFETRCNLKCWHCSSSEYINRRNRLTIEQIEIILKKLKSVGVLSVCYVGGEPLICEELEAIIKLTHNYKIIPSIITNATLLNEQKIDDLFKAGLGNMGFSLQSMSGQIHDKLVNREGAYVQMMKCIDYCLKKKYICSLCAVPTNENLGDGNFDKIIRFAQERDLRINVNLPAPVGKLTHDITNLLSQESLTKLVDDYFPLDNFLPDFKQVRVNRKTTCPMGRDSIYVFPGGQVCPCTFVHVSFGNILRESIDKILQRMEESPLLKGVDRGQCPIGMDKNFIEKINRINEDSSKYPAKWDEIRV